MNIRARGISYHIHKFQENPLLPNLLLLHGFMGNGEQFEHLAARLSPVCNPVAIDLLGHGKTEGAELHYHFSTKEQVAGLKQLLTSLFEDRFFLHGYSMGGRLALQFALRNQNLLRGLILESSTFGIEDEQEKQARQALDAERADAITGNFKQFLSEWNQMPLFKNGKALNKNLQEKLAFIQRKQNPQWISNSLLGFGSGSMPCVKDELSSLAIPTLLLAGEQDAKFVRIANTMQKLIAQSSAHVIPKTGHRIHLESPDAFGEQLRSFIKQNSQL